MTFLSQQLSSKPQSRGVAVAKRDESDMAETATSSSSIMDTSALATQFSWSITASVAPDGSGVAVEPNNSVRQVGERQFDVTQSTEWMEFLEYQEGRGDDAGGAGAYDTLRCDLIISLPSTASNRETSSDRAGQNHRRIWGEEYHLTRLRASYASLFKAIMNDPHAQVDSDVLDNALRVSKSLMERMLLEAENSQELMVDDNDTAIAREGYGDVLAQLVRVTLLWSPSQKSSSDEMDQIVVRGHACSSCKPIKIHAIPEPIVVSIAVHTGKDAKDDDATIDESLPTRYGDPQSKIASWCRERKAMENPSTYKPPGTSEVLMVRKRVDVDGKARLEVLEGLSSNFFVIDKHGSLRTDTEGVLNGFVRHLVLQVATKCGLKFDPRPVYLHEACTWKEAFITSSSRLIYPISKILLPADHNHDDVTVNATATASTTFLQYWRDPYFDAENHSSRAKTPKWQELLNEVLRTGGYPSVESKDERKVHL
jgi:hypothetical protein